MTRSRTTTRAASATLLLLSTLAVAACSSSSDGSSSTGGGIAGSAQKDSKAAGDGVIKIGLLSTLDGPYAALGQAANMGAKVALVDAGATLDGTGDRNGIKDLTIGGQKVELVVESSDATPDAALAATQRLVEKDDVDVVVGPLSGDEGLAVKDYAKQHLDTTFVNGTSGAQNTTLRDPAPNFFRFTTDGAQWMAGLGDYAFTDLGYKKVVTLGEDYSFPYDQVGGFMTQYCAAGGQVPDKIWVPLGTKDFSSFIATMPTDVDAILVALGGADVLNFTKQIDQSPLAGKPILGGSIAVDGSVVKGLGERAEGIVSAGPVAELDTPEYKAYAAQLTKLFPNAAPPGLFDVGYYTEMKATLDALNTIGGKLEDGHKALNETLSGMQVVSPSGPVKLDENRQAIANNYIFQVTDGASKMIKTIPDVNQTLGMDRAEYVDQPANDRDHPSCP
ncbi:ABC transporter substrate-binding protein [Nocardioides conyzicola]|uniref:ABC transporter substrate-binding protein n=1 Tax=Nocardioides conyzicola TaxID=1651781 RepID=A0ABP8X2L9_9ACTN